MITSSTTTPTLTTSSTTVTLGQSNNFADIVFIIDSTYLQGGTDYWQQVINFIISIVNSLDIGPSANQIGLVVIGWPASSKFYLNSYATKSSLVTALQSVTYTAQWTHLAKGLHEATYNQFTATHGDR